MDEYIECRHCKHNSGKYTRVLGLGHKTNTYECMNIDDCCERIFRLYELDESYKVKGLKSASKLLEVYREVYRNGFFDYKEQFCKRVINIFEKLNSNYSVTVEYENLVFTIHIKPKYTSLWELCEQWDLKSWFPNYIISGDKQNYFEINRKTCCIDWCLRAIEKYNTWKNVLMFDMTFSKVNLPNDVKILIRNALGSRKRFKGLPSRNRVLYLGKL
jgi:hypothetical protein